MCVRVLLVTLFACVCVLCFNDKTRMYSCILIRLFKFANKHLVSEASCGGGRGLGLWRQSELWRQGSLAFGHRVRILRDQGVLLQVSSDFVDDVTVEVREAFAFERRWPLVSGLQEQGTASPVGGLSLGQGSKSCVATRV